MEINLLALSVGNSRLALGTFVSGELSRVTRVPHAQRNDWPAAIRDYAGKLAAGAFAAAGEIVP